MLIYFKIFIIKLESVRSTTSTSNLVQKKHDAKSWAFQNNLNLNKKREGL